MSKNDKETKKAANALSESLRIFTKENILTTATKEEYEGGVFKFKSVGGQEIGRIKVAEYRKFEKQPFKEPLVYVVQLINYLWVLLNVLSKVMVLVPICYFWLLVAVAIYGGVELKSLAVADLYSPALLQFSFLMVFMSIFIGGVFFHKIRGLGYIDIFKKRFHRLLDQEIPALKDYDQYKLEWVKA